jgi:hypothetical protein
METEFAAGALAVQVVVIAQPLVSPEPVSPEPVSPDPVSLEDVPTQETLKAVLAAPVARRVLVLAGAAGEDWLPAGFDLVGLRGANYGERIAAALADAYAAAALPMLLIRSDALGVGHDMVEDAARSLTSAEADSVFGPASDGGFWLLGLRRPDRSLVAGIPAPGDGAGPGAGRVLLERLASAGLRVAIAPRLEIEGAAALRF